MFSLNKVIFPVDFSNRCRGAARLLDSLHENFRPVVTLIHVLPPPHFEYSMADLGGGLVQEYTAARTEQARKDLEYFLDEELKHYQLKRVLLEGDPARKIVEFAHNEGADLIVMPTHGYGGFRRFMLGSVTAKVLHDADCPVLTGVHMEEVAEADNLKVRNVAACLDLGPASEKVLRWASEFAAACKARLTIFHATPSVEGLAGEYFEPNWRERFASEASARIADLQKLVGTDGKVVVDAGDVSRVTCQLAKQNHTDVMVIGRGSTSGVFGRIRAHAYSIIRQSPCPVISV
ncbi:MAG: universal stress protein [Bryobacteraceae bacterium]|nr:universal stress protein [Bryobacteraceae bacterium]MDW8380416.1 universal stress protein [Bryobacterales bacterium]